MLEAKSGVRVAQLRQMWQEWRLEPNRLFWESIFVIDRLLHRQTPSEAQSCRDIDTGLPSKRDRRIRAHHCTDCSSFAKH
jgi:hypothetical protein